MTGVYTIPDFGPSDLLTSAKEGERSVNVRTESPDGLYSGTRAITTQNYTEANAKNGVQYELATYNPALAAGATTDYIVITGAKTVSIKGRALQFDGSGLRLETYEGPTYTGGAPVPYYNLNFKNPVSGLAQIIGGMTVTNPGVQKASHKVLLGSTGQGNSVLSSASNEAQGLETVLNANSVYLFRTVSLSATGAQRVASFSTWFEGDLDFPLA